MQQRKNNRNGIILFYSRVCHFLYSISIFCPNRRDPRGFAVKFYTEEGIWDLVGNNTPIFFVKDPLMFPSFIHTQKRNPVTHLKVRSLKNSREFCTPISINRNSIFINGLSWLSTPLLSDKVPLILNQLNNYPIALMEIS